MPGIFFPENCLVVIRASKSRIDNDRLPDLPPEFFQLVHVLVKSFRNHQQRTAGTDAFRIKEMLCHSAV